MGVPRRSRCRMDSRSSGYDFGGYSWVSSRGHYQQQDGSSRVRDHSVRLRRHVPVGRFPGYGGLQMGRWLVVVVHFFQRLRGFYTKILQNNDITFVPQLPSEYRNAIWKFEMEPAVKVFLEFTEPFYPSYLIVESDWEEFGDGCQSQNYADRLFYDETYGQETSRHILGMFAYARAADRYTALSDEAAVVTSILNELDTMFDGKASATYTGNFVMQDWSKEPYVSTGYTRWVRDDPGPINVFQRPIDGKVLFAGESLPPNDQDWGYVHGAALSGKRAAELVICLDEEDDDCDVRMIDTQYASCGRRNKSVFCMAMSLFVVGYVRLFVA
mmetsp:Transcript_2341/g.4321  ORF Transcript_2341/g.4321 Transcript_2341/m.4321 type:complete len:328 (-) Transcript_2341:81-1064(-)